MNKEEFINTYNLIGNKALNFCTVEGHNYCYFEIEDEEIKIYYDYAEECFEVDFDELISDRAYNESKRRQQQKIIKQKKENLKGLKERLRDISKEIKKLENEIQQAEN